MLFDLSAVIGEDLSPHQHQCLFWNKYVKCLIVFAKTSSNANSPDMYICIYTYVHINIHLGLACELLMLWSSSSWKSCSKSMQCGDRILQCCSIPQLGHVSLFGWPRYTSSGNPWLPQVQCPLEICSNSVTTSDMLLKCVCFCRKPNRRRLHAILSVSYSLDSLRMFAHGCIEIGQKRMGGLGFLDSAKRT